MEARSSRTAWYSSASFASSSHAWASCTLMPTPPAGEVGERSAPCPGSVRFPSGEGLLRCRPCVCAVRLVIGDNHEAHTRGVIAPGAGLVGVAEPVVRGVKKPPEHHWVRHAREVSIRVPV
jgi:hypothetical protein